MMCRQPDRRPIHVTALGADLEAVNEKGWTPLTMAEGVFYSNTGKRWPEIEKLLLELGARRRSP